MLKAHLLSEEQVNEKKLFHETSPENVEAICEKNFDPRIHNKNKKLKLGNGTYFAVNALCSHSYAKIDSDLLQVMFLAKVLVGCYTKGHPSYRRPPAKDLANVDIHLYDSCVDNVLNPTIYVVFDRNHFYPEYVIQYLAAQPLPSPSLLLKKRSAQRLIRSSSIQSSSSASVSNEELTGTTPRRSSDNFDTASLPSGSATPSSYSVAAVSNAELTGTHPTRSSENIDTASLPSCSATQSSYSAATVSNAELTGATPTRSSDNLDTASLPSGSATQSSYTVLTVSNGELTGTSVNSSPDRLCTSSFPSGFIAESGNSASTVPSADLTGTTWTKCPASTKGGSGAEGSYSTSALFSSLVLIPD